MPPLDQLCWVCGCNICIVCCEFVCTVCSGWVCCSHHKPTTTLDPTSRNIPHGREVSGTLESGDPGLKSLACVGFVDYVHCGAKVVA